MRRYEDGYSPEPQEGDKPGEGVKHEKSTVKVKLEIDRDLYNDLEALELPIMEYLRIVVRVKKLLSSRPGTTVLHYPDGSEEPIVIVL